MVASGREVRLVRHADGALEPDHFAIVEAPIRDPADGEVLVRNRWTSVDPGLRLRMRETGPAGYFEGFALDAPLDGILTVGEVLESRADGFRPGDTVWHAAGWREYATVRAGVPALNGLGTLAVLDTAVAPPPAYLGALGGMGLTAYAGLVHAAELTEGDVVWVSAAAGAVGSLAVQLARALGCRVVASVGSAEKVEHVLRDLRADAAFSHRDRPLAESLRAAAPDGIDVYFDNVGGEHLEAALNALRPGGRVALCGAIADYDRARPASGPSNLFQATANGLTLRGFRGSAYVDELPAVQRRIANWIDEGSVRPFETVRDGLESAPEALIDLLAGRTVGKTLVRIDATESGA
jgi:NADPH-dependent curcumin reductase CurA